MISSKGDRKTDDVAHWGIKEDGFSWALSDVCCRSPS